MLHFDTRAEALRTPPVRCTWPARIVLTNGKLNAALKDLLCVSLCLRAFLETAGKRIKNKYKEQVRKGGSPPLVANSTQTNCGPPAGVNRPSLLVLFKFHLFMGLSDKQSASVVNKALRDTQKRAMKLYVVSPARVNSLRNSFHSKDSPKYVYR